MFQYLKISLNIYRAGASGGTKITTSVALVSLLHLERAKGFHPLLPLKFLKLVLMYLHMFIYVFNIFKHLKYFLILILYFLIEPNKGLAESVASARLHHQVLFVLDLEIQHQQIEIQKQGFLYEDSKAQQMTLIKDLSSLSS